MNILDKVKDSFSMCEIGSEYSRQEIIMRVVQTLCSNCNLGKRDSI